MPRQAEGLPTNRGNPLQGIWTVMTPRMPQAKHAPAGDGLAFSRGGWTAVAVAALLSIGGAAVWAQIPPAASLPAVPSTDPSPSELSRLILRIAGQSDAQVRLDSAKAILRTFSDEGVRALLDILETKNNEAAKLAVCQAIAQVQSDNPTFIPALLTLLDHKEPALREAAAAALSGFKDPQVTARLEELERLLIEKRFMAVCRQLYTLLPTDADRVSQLQRWLKSTLALERLTALEVIHEKMSAGSRPAPDLLLQIRQMLADKDARVRQRLIIVLRDIRQPEDALRVRAMLDVEKSPAVREEIYKALGYLGDTASVAACLTGLNDPVDTVAAQAAAALGRLAEKSAARSQSQTLQVEAAVAALLRRTETGITNPALREQVIEAMARIADPRFLPVLTTYASSEEKVPAIRQAAIRGLGLLGGADQVALVADRLVNDTDPGVREVAAEAMGRLGSRVEHLRPLRDRLDPKAEPAVAVQTKSWEAYRTLFLKVLTPADQGALLDTWTETDPVTLGRRIELLADLEKQLSSGAADPRRLAAAREQLGDVYLAVGRGLDAAGAYSRVLDVLSPGETETTGRVTGKLMDAYLRTPAPDKAIALAAEARTPQLRDLLAGRLLDYVRQSGATNRVAVVALLDRLTQMVPDRFGPSWASRFDEARHALPSSQPATLPS